MNKDNLVLCYWVAKHKKHLSEHQQKLAIRFCKSYTRRTEYPIGRGIARFMMLFNERNTNIVHFTREEINFYYVY